jgi:hypothetical protein
LIDGVAVKLSPGSRLAGSSPLTIYAAHSRFLILMRLKAAAPKVSIQPTRLVR